jgi:hypothetical protein
MNIARVLPVFSVAFIVIYAIALYFNIPLVTYYPTVGQFHWTAQPNLPGPAMYYYGWLANAAIGATVIAGIAALIPALQVKLWSGWIWIAALAAIVLVVYVNRVWFIH